MQQPGRTTLHSGAFLSARGLLIRLRSACRRMAMRDDCPNPVFRSSFRLPSGGSWFRFGHDCRGQVIERTFYRQRELFQHRDVARGFYSGPSRGPRFRPGAELPNGWPAKCSYHAIAVRQARSGATPARSSNRQAGKSPCRARRPGDLAYPARTTPQEGNGGWSPCSPDNRWPRRCHGDEEMS
jgi:hypothetical protein